MWTTFCQVLAPIFGLLVIVGLKKLGSSNLQAILGKSLYIPIPFVFNIPYKPFSTLGQYFNVSECN